jgi:hypothetical protein
MGGTEKVIIVKQLSLKKSIKHEAVVTMIGWSISLSTTLQ